MRQQAGFAQHQAGDVFEVIERRREAQFRQRIACACITQLRLVAEREQHFLAAERRTVARDAQYVLGFEIGLLEMPGRLRECAVVADNTTQLRPRPQYIARVAAARDTTAPTPGSGPG